MSTNINITVGGDDLIRRAQAEQAAHRQLQQIASSRQAAGEKGQAERNKRLANQGLDGSKNLVPTAPFQPNRQAEELTANIENVFGYGQGYFTVTRGENDIAVVTVRSGNKSVVLTESLSGSEIPVGFRDRAGADKLPPLPRPPAGTIDPLGNNTVEVLVDTPYNVKYIESTDIVVTQPPLAPGYVSATITTYIKQHVNARISSGGEVVQVVAGTSAGGWPTFGSAYNSNLIILPLSNNLAIFAYTETRYSFKSYFIEDLAYVEYLPYETSTCTPGPVTYSCIEQVSEHRTDTSKIAYLVGKSSIKKISYPQHLLSASTSSYWYVPPELTDVLVEGQSSGMACNTPFYYTFKGRHYILNSPAVPDNLQYAQTLALYWGEALQYTLYNRASPGIYSVLGSQITPVALPAKYADIKSLLPPAGQNFQWFRVDENTDPDQLQRYRGELPEYYGDPFDETAFTRIKSVTYEQQPDENYYRWTDWGKPAYCRQQALALGFSPNDLKP